MGSATSESEVVSHLIGDIYDAALDPGQWVGTLHEPAGWIVKAGKQ